MLQSVSFFFFVILNMKTYAWKWAAGRTEERASVIQWEPCWQIVSWIRQVFTINPSFGEL